MTLVEQIAIIASIGFTIGALTLPIRDNVYWKICEHMYLGFAAGYTVIIGYSALQSNLFTQLSEGNIIYVVPLILSLLLYSRYSKQYYWLNRYPVAVMVGVGTAVSMRTVVNALIIGQIKSSILNPVASIGDQVGSPATAVNNIIVLFTVVSVLLFFVFWRTDLLESSVLSGIRGVGRTLLMISFGVVMGNSLIMRVSRLGARFFTILAPSNMMYTGDRKSVV